METVAKMHTMNAATQRTTLRIYLAEPVLFMRGEQGDAAGCFLRGDLVLSLARQSRLKNLQLKFEGRSITRWPRGTSTAGLTPSPGKKSIIQKREVIDDHQVILHVWEMLPAREDGTDHLLPSGVHTFPFELFLPGTLPETIETRLGSVKYSITANATRAGRLVRDITVNQEVRVVRDLPDYLIAESISIGRDWQGQLAYEISIPHKAYPVGSEIPVEMHFQPITCGTQVCEVAVELLERICVNGGGGDGGPMRIRRTTEDVISLVTDSTCGDILESVLPSSRYLTIPLPRRGSWRSASKSLLHLTCDTVHIKVSHHLRIHIRVRTAIGRFYEVVQPLGPVGILSCRVAERHEALPAYGDRSMCPCNPVFREKARVVLGGEPIICEHGNGGQAHQHVWEEHSEMGGSPPPKYEDVIEMAA